MLWGSRFNEALNKNALIFSSSLSFDIELIFCELKVNKAHAQMLAGTAIISNNESDEIINGLNKIEKEYRSGKWKPDADIYEDIHSAIEGRLTELVGAAAGKLHSGRSRNDLAATSFRLWVIESSDKLICEIIELQKTLLAVSEKHADTLMPGYTHLQWAQPVTLAFHLLAYYEMLERSKARLEFVKRESDSMTLGSGALAGSTLPIDRKSTAEKLRFNNISENALDAVSDRDFAADFLNACALGIMQLSRLSEELILWSTTEWNFIKIGDSYSTGSSLMPQKRNPDMAELIRGKTGRVFGNYTALLTTLKGLPLSYNRDLQEDKPPVFDSHYTYLSSLKIMNEMLKVTDFNENRFIEEMEKGYMLATDLADWLVVKKIPFREAHSIAGKVVKFAEQNNKGLGAVTLDELRSINPVFDKSALAVLNINNSLEKKITLGSPNPVLIRRRINELKEKLNVT